MLKTIVVVEDDNDQRDLIRAILLGAGYMVRSVSNGLEAAASCISVVPDLIISDVRMPRMNGFEMIRTLKSELELRDIPVIFLSLDASGREQGNGLGAVEYLTKPIKSDVLLAAVSKGLCSA